MWGWSSRKLLEERSGLRPKQIWAILNRTTKHTVLSVADELLTAMERTDMLDFDVQVVPNPMLSQELWAERMRERGCY